MTLKQVREILAEVRTWPPEQQAKRVRAVELIKEQDESEALLLGEDKAAEMPSAGESAR